MRRWWLFAAVASILLPGAVFGVELEAPTEVVAGASIEVRWSGTPQGRDYVTLVEPGAAEGSWGNYVYVSVGNPLTIRAPDVPGEYEIRYQSESREGVFGQRAIRVVGATATLSAPATVVAGSEVSVSWTGPNNQGDYIIVVTAGAAEGSWDAYRYTSVGNPLTLQVPDKTGPYEIRYANGQSNSTLAAIPLTVTSAGASVEAPTTAVAGSVIEVQWTGPDNRGDYIIIVPVGGRNTEWESYELTTSGSPLKLATAEIPGEYEVRYATAQSNATLASTSITLTPASASLSAPETATAGTSFAVEWQGPGNPNDFIAIVPTGAEEGTWIHYAGVHWGETVTLKAPREPGSHELRYVTGRSGTTLARRPITITPGREPGRVIVRRGAGSGPVASTSTVFELILDASGSMLKRDRGERRIVIARKALTHLIEESLPADSMVALRVFGHLEPNSCRTDLVVGLRPLDRSALSAEIAAIEAKNLAKTPIGDSLSRVAGDLDGSEGPVNVILVTDGEETCGGDPAGAIADLKGAGVDVQVNIVGFAIDDVMLKNTFREWARLGDGRYFDAGNLEELTRGLVATLDPRFEILDAAGARIGLGAVDGPAVELDPGDYTIRPLDGASPERQVNLASGQELVVEL
jgi:hypothetical protein